MSISLYDVSIPVFIRAFENMAKFLDKGRRFADEKGIPHSELLEARISEDMAPPTSQVQRASDGAKFMAARMAQVEAPRMEDNEASFEELQARIAATIAFLKSIPASAMDGREDAEITIPTPNRTFSFRGTPYVLEFALPNVFFHVTTAYALLRMKGVPVGKLDYLGDI
jgi:hypothetical protein